MQNRPSRHTAIETIVLRSDEGQGGYRKVAEAAVKATPMRLEFERRDLIREIA